MLNLRLPIALALMAAAYLISFLAWALIWHGVYWCAPMVLAVLYDILCLLPNRHAAFLRLSAWFTDTIAFMQYIAQAHAECVCTKHQAKEASL